MQNNFNQGVDPFSTSQDGSGPVQKAQNEKNEMRSTGSNCFCNLKSLEQVQLLPWPHPLIQRELGPESLTWEKKEFLPCLFKPECFGWSYQPDKQPTAFEEFVPMVLHFGHDVVWLSALRSLNGNSLNEGKWQV